MTCRHCLWGSSIYTLHCIFTLQGDKYRHHFTDEEAEVLRACHCPVHITRVIESGLEPRANSHAFGSARKLPYTLYIINIRSTSDKGCEIHSLKRRHQCGKPCRESKGQRWNGSNWIRSPAYPLCRRSCPVPWRGSPETEGCVQRPAIPRSLLDTLRHSLIRSFGH